MKLNQVVKLLNQYSSKFGEQNILQILCDTDNDDNVQIGFGKSEYNQDKEVDDQSKIIHQYLVVNKSDTKKCLGLYPLLVLAENVIKCQSNKDDWTVMEFNISE